MNAADTTPPGTGMVTLDTQADIAGVDIVNADDLAVKRHLFDAQAFAWAPESQCLLAWVEAAKVWQTPVPGEGRGLFLLSGERAPVGADLVAADLPDCAGRLWRAHKIASRWESELRALAHQAGAKNRRLVVEALVTDDGLRFEPPATQE